MEHITKLLSNRWFLGFLFAVLTGGNISQLLYTGHNPEVLPTYVEKKQVPDIPKVVIRKVPHETIERICKEANHSHEREYHNVR